MNKSLNHSIDESWIDRAIEMMEAGYESENLYMLAGTLKPYTATVEDVCPPDFFHSVSPTFLYSASHTSFVTGACQSNWIDWGEDFLPSCK